MTRPLTAAYADLLLAEQAREAENALSLSWGGAAPEWERERVRALSPYNLKARIEIARETVRWQVARAKRGEISREKAREDILWSLRHWRQTRRQLKALYASLPAAAE